MDNEWTKEIETLRARLAALEAALRWVEERKGHIPVAADALSGGTAAIDAAVAAAVDARVAAIRARVIALETERTELVYRDDVLSAIGGAP